MVTGKPFMPSMARRYCSNCSSSSGKLPCRPMNKNSLLKSPTPTAPANTAASASSGISMLASSSIFWPSKVTAGVCLSLERRSRSKSPCLCLKPYSAKIMGEGSTMTTPMSPSMMIQSSWRMSWLALLAPTTAGMSKLRATMAVCDVLPPTSVTNPVNTLCLNCSMSAGDKSCATNTKGTSMVSPNCNSCCGLACGLVLTTGEVPPFKKCKTRSVTCSRSDLRSRK